MGIAHLDTIGSGAIGLAQSPGLIIYPPTPLHPGSIGALQMRQAVMMVAGQIPAS